MVWLDCRLFGLYGSFSLLCVWYIQENRLTLHLNRAAEVAQRHNISLTAHKLPQQNSIRANKNNSQWV
nr:MAG TPA: hypothetical protein [Bacteriophage sp.]